jgi:hypothetical protein
MSLCWRRLHGLSAFLLLFGIVLGLVRFDLVHAAIQIGSAGNFGAHGMTDTSHSPGATCRFAPPLAWSLGETWLQVRPPVMFARDATDRFDEQLVGWRAVILTLDPASGGWLPIAEGKTQRAVATEDLAALFDSRGLETEFFLPYGSYLVTAELFWYERMGAGEEPRLAGQAVYQVEHYAIAVRDRGRTHLLDVAGRCQLES